MVVFNQGKKESGRKRDREKRKIKKERKKGRAE